MWQLRRMLETDLEEPRYVRSVRGTAYLFAFEFRPKTRYTPDQ
jgi:hypothetical protein